MKEDGRLKKFAAINLPKQKPKKCINCTRPYKPMRKGRCEACYDYLRNNGKERPPNPGHLRDKKRKPVVVGGTLRNRKSRASGLSLSTENL